ncbi:unnamed protein product [Phytophthora lilii]|uniref:Unnamed protein product n=1 Tax=Phytophthora lilii TaxID=2077276 RepID=A0A9W6TN19_9STRA|nr:unnamed protein product [Phytophthora lilii]
MVHNEDSPQPGPRTLGCTRVPHRTSANHEARTWFEDSGSPTPTDVGQSQARILSSLQDGSFVTFKVYPEGGCAST